MKKLVVFSFIVFILFITTNNVFNFKTIASAKEGEIILPVIMYHQIYDKGVGPYRVSRETLDKDLTELDKQGYKSITSKELIDYVNKAAALPEKPVLITFDDGYYNNVFYGEEILRKHNAKAIINVVGSFADGTEKRHEEGRPAYSNLTWQQMNDIDKDVFELGNHSYSLHQKKPRFGMKKLLSESEEQYKSKMTEDVMHMQQKLIEKTGTSPVVFAYPFGAYNDRVESYLAESGFKIILTCTEKPNVVKEGSSLPIVLGRFNRDGKYTSEEFVKKISKRA